MEILIVPFDNEVDNHYDNIGSPNKENHSSSGESQFDKREYIESLNNIDPNGKTPPNSWRDRLLDRINK